MFFCLAGDWRGQADKYLPPGRVRMAAINRALRFSQKDAELVMRDLGSRQVRKDVELVITGFGPENGAICGLWIDLECGMVLYVYQIDALLPIT